MNDQNNGPQQNTAVNHITDETPVENLQEPMIDMPPELMMELTPDERRHLEKLEAKYQVIRDRTLLVAGGWSTGMYIYGEGGIGKSFNVIKTLRELKLNFHLLNTRLSGPAFAQELAMNPVDLFVVEDIKDVLGNPGAMNLLQSALWGQRDDTGKMVRIITYTVMRNRFQFQFEGQVIFTGNSPLSDIPELRALGTRIPVYKLQVTRDEIFAVGKSLAIKGFKCDRGVLDPKICLEIFEWYRRKLPMHRTPDLRTLERAWLDYMGIQEMGPLLKCRWQDLLESSLRESTETKEERRGKPKAKGIRTRPDPDQNLRQEKRADIGDIEARVASARQKLLERQAKATANGQGHE